MHPNDKGQSNSLRSAQQVSVNQDPKRTHMSNQSVNPRTGESFGPIIEDTSTEEIESIITLSVNSFKEWSAFAPSRRTQALVAIADALEGSSDELAELADKETGLGMPRLVGEVGRTAFQIREFANALSRGEFISPLVDSAVDAPLPKGHPELVRTFAPIGVVVVFGASNFPFAFSVLGGDTASALAAGCTVIAKAHPAHPQTSNRVYELAVAALREVGAPEGTLGLIHGVKAGKILLEDDRIDAGAFTGSRQGGRALFDLANTRPRPVPFYGELGSVNPVVVMESALSDSKTFAANYLDSLLLGNGQFCTNPSVLFIPEDSQLIAEIESQMAIRTPSPFLSEATKALHDKNRESLSTLIDPKIFLGQEATVEGFYSTPAIFVSSVEHVSSNESALSIECFGPTGLVLTYKNIEQVRDLISKMEGALVASIFSAMDDPDAASVVQSLSKKVGRVAWNAWPTGVAVTAGQQHGGPYPASTSPIHTSVGLPAINRFLRPISFQSLPSAILNQVAVNIERS